MGIAAGTYDRVVTISRRQNTQSNSGQTSITWVPILSNVYARMVPSTGAQGYEQEQRVSTDVKVFQVRYTGIPVRQGYQLEYDGEVYNITDVAEIGRRVAYELRCVTKDNV